MSTTIPRQLTKLPTSRLCEMWKIYHDRMMSGFHDDHCHVQVNNVQRLIDVENELKRRWPEQFTTWMGTAWSDHDAYNDPHRFFVITNAEEKI